MEFPRDEKQLLVRLQQHFQQGFSYLNRLIEAYFTSKSNKQGDPKLNQIRKHLKQELAPFKDDNSQPFFCGKEFAPAKSSRKINAYTCQECRQEFNSTVCQECFDISKHEGHSYKRVQLASGSCDCGCRSKWSEKSFCQVHKYNDKKIDEMIEKQEFRKKLHYFCKILHIVSSFTKQLKAQQQSILKVVDEFCVSFVEEINELSRRDKAANQTTSSLLGQKVLLIPSGEVQIKEVLLSFTKLQKTAEKCVQLFNTLFVLSESLQAEIADIYLNRPNEFLSNPYRHLKHIIFSNGLLGEDQWLSGKVFDLSKTSKDQSFVQQVRQAYSDQYAKINIINNLHRDSSIICWANFYQNGKFNCLGNYCTFLTTQEHHTQLNQSHYDIEQIFLGEMIRTIDIIRQEDFFPKICFDLFQKITKKTEKAHIPNNLLFTYERLWAVCTYALILQKNGNFEASFESFLQLTLRLESSQTSVKKFIILFDKILKYMQTSNIRPVAHLKQHNSFVNVYYNNYGYFDRNGVLLASIDAIFFKIVVRMLNYFSPKARIIHNKINQYIQIVFVKALNNLPQTSIKNRFLCLTNFIQKLHECLYSQYPDLFLATKFQAFRTKEYYINKHKGYLHNMLSSLHVQAIDAKTFDQLFKHFFFDAPEAFISFKKQMAEHQRFLPAKAIGRKINILFLASLVGKRSAHTQKYYIQDNIPFEARTYPDQKYSQPLQYDLLQSQAFQSVNNIFQRLCQNMMIRQLGIIFRTIRYIVAYPQPQPHRKTKIQEYIQATEVFVFKTRRYKENQQELIKGFVADKYQKQDEQDLFEQYRAQEQGQRDQELKQRQARKRYDNNSPSQIGRIQHKQTKQKQQSGKSSKQSASASEQTVQFKVKCSKCIKPAQKIVLPCYVSFKRVPSVFDILPNQKCLIFTSCQHFFHQQKECLPKIEDSGFKSCPICSKRFNFLLILPDTYIEQDELKSSRIERMLDNTYLEQSKIPKIMQEKGQWYLKALKSFVWFFLMVSMATKVQESDFYVYKTLGKMLRLYFRFSKIHKQKESIMAKMLFTKEDSKHRDLIKYLTCIVGEVLLPHQREKFIKERQNISLLLSSKQTQNIKRAISQCLEISCTLPVSSFIQPQKIHLFELPDTLELLTQRHMGICQSCKSSPKISFIICLHPLHQPKNMQEKACISCIDPFISQHIRIIQLANRTEKYVRHEQQMLTITSDTGDITYFARIDKKIWMIQLGSVYQDENFNSLTLGQAINADKIPNRKAFTLKKQKYEEIALNFYMRRYLGSSSLQMFLEQ